MKHLCVVPARSGSSGLPGKNLRKLGSLPLVSWSIRQALHTKEFSDIVVNSDGDDFEVIAKQEGVKFLKRPMSLAGGDVLVDRVVSFTLDQLEVKQKLGPYDFVTVLNPTTPLRTPAEIKQCLREIESNRYQSVVTITEVAPIEMIRLRAGKRGLWHQDPHCEGRNRQQRVTSLFQNGGVFTVQAKYFRETGRLIGHKCGVVAMPKEHSVDIDDIWDFLAAEAYLKELSQVEPIYESIQSGQVLPS